MSDSLARVGTRVSADPSTAESPRPLRAAPTRTAPRPSARDDVEPSGRMDAERSVNAPAPRPLMLMEPTSTTRVRAPIAAQADTPDPAVVHRDLVGLREHSEGQAVSKLQRALNVYFEREELDVDGAFGGLTESAVMRFQRAQGLEGDGIVGRDTVRALGPHLPAPAQTPEAPAAEVQPTLPPSDGVQAQIDRAVAALRPLVREQSHPEALRMAVTAYFNYRAENPSSNTKLWFTDFGISSARPRGYVFDMQSLRVIEGPFHVSHGVGRGARTNAHTGVPRFFSNRDSTHESSLGLYTTSGGVFRTGAGGGNNAALSLVGRSGRFNDAALAREIIIHGADYVTESRAGRSWGCPAISRARANRMLPQLGAGTVLYSFSPHDSDFMRSEPWANRAS